MTSVAYYWRSYIFGIMQIAISTLAKDAYYIVKGGPNNDCLDVDCVTRTLNAQETAGVRCCADYYPGGSTWTYVDSCDIYIISNLFHTSYQTNDQPNCYITTWEKAFWLCDKAGGRLCTKSELENGCAADNGNGSCDFDSYMMWSSTSGELPEGTYLDTNSLDSGAAYYYVAQGRSGQTCWEPSCSTAIVSQYDVRGVRCCSEKQEDYDWRGSSCGIWADSDFPFCYIVDWETANSTCSYAGGRLCTKTEIQRDCTIWTGCFFDHMTLWTSDVATIDDPTVSPTIAPTVEPTGSPTKTLTVDPTETPTETPTDPPTQTPTNSPSKTPITVNPTESPTETPTDPPTQTPTNSPSKTPTVALGTPKARWVKVGCNTDGVYTEVIKDQIIREKSPTISFSEFHELLLTELLFEGEIVNGKIPSILAKTWEYTYSTHTSNTYRCDYFDNLVPFTGGCMWRLEVVVGLENSKMIWMPHIVKCSKVQPKCAPLIACANEDCSQCKKELLSFQNTITFF